ncbi:Hypothetical predicted protein [Marmota monax]|uniref:Uncharacterized protein n=1 Tax=Marmota monax TaxID=9995 RepID=A0A5E4BEG6_MARMO|nr:Hypothetical predicted protein [Marmota monax]
MRLQVTLSLNEFLFDVIVLLCRPGPSGPCFDTRRRNSEGRTGGEGPALRGRYRHRYKLLSDVTLVVFLPPTNA